MRLIAVHDEAGKILMLFTSPANSPSGENAIEPGQLKTEVETSDLGLEPGASNTVDRLNEIIESYRVERQSAPHALGRLTRFPAK